MRQGDRSDHVHLDMSVAFGIRLTVMSRPPSPVTPLKDISNGFLQNGTKGIKHSR